MRFLLPIIAFSLAAFAVAQERKLPAPEAAALARARALVHEVFAADLKNATSSDARLKLANVLMAQARENKDEPANRFVLLEEAQGLAAAGGDIHLALTLLDDLARDFDIDPFPRKTVVLAQAAAAAPTVEAARTLVDLVLPLITEAVEADQYGAALELCKIAQTAAGKSKDSTLYKAVARRNDEVVAVRDGFARLKGAIERIKVEPRDPKANLELGRYYSLLKGRWDKALPLLAMAQGPLAELARRDLGKPKTPADQGTLADAWWEQALTEKDPGRLALQSRAGYWYERALPGLAGLNRTKAVKRLDRVASMRAGLATESSTGPVGELKRFVGHADEIKAVALSSDGRFGLSGSVDQTARLWDLVSGKEEKLFRGHTKQIWSVGLVPGNRFAATASWDATARLWDLRTGNEARRFSHRLDVNGLALSRSGDLLLTGCDDHNAYLWNVASGEEVRRFTGHTGFVYGVAFSPDGKYVATSSVDKSVRVHDLATGNLVKAFEGHSSPVNTVVFSPDSRYVFSCGDAAPRMWEIATGQLVRRFEGHSGFALTLALSGDGRRLITGGDDKLLRLWDVATGKELHKLSGHDGSITSVAISSDGRKALSGSLDRTVRLWGLPSR